MTSKDSLNKYPSFNGEWYALWKEYMWIFIEGVVFDILKVVENGMFVPTHQINDVVVIKKEDEWAKEEREKVNWHLKS